MSSLSLRVAAADGLCSTFFPLAGNLSLGKGKRMCADFTWFYEGPQAKGCAAGGERRGGKLFQLQAL